MKGRVWVFDRGIVSEDNLQDLRERGAYYLVGTPRHKLLQFERELLEGDWQEIAGKPGVRLQLLQEGGETFVLARSLQVLLEIAWDFERRSGKIPECGTLNFMNVCWD
jgi:hypothetical protein